MARQLNLNFNGAPPSSGGGTDYVPPARYSLAVTKTSDPQNRSSTGKPMVVFSFKIDKGPQKGKRLRDQFVLPQSANDQKVGLQRLHAALLALGMRIPNDRKFKLDLDSVVGRKCVADVADSILPAQENRPARTVSSVDTYIIPGVRGRADATGHDEDEDEDDEDEEEDEEEEDEDEEDDEDADDDEEDEDEEEEPAPPPTARRKGKAAAAAPAPARGRRAAAAAAPPAASGRRGRRAPAADKEDDAFGFDAPDDDD